MKKATERIKHMTERKIGIGLIGIGGWARYGHIPALKSLDSFVIKGIYSRSQEKADALAAELGAEKGYSELDEMLKADDIDLYLVLTPGPTHAAISRKVIEAGKNVYTEWPLASSVKEVQEICDLAKEKGVRTMIGMQRNLAPSARYFRDLIRNGYVGDLYNVNLRLGIDAFNEKVHEGKTWFTEPDSYTDPLTIYAGHFSRLLFSLVGEPKTMQSVLRKNFDSFIVQETGDMIPNMHPTEGIAIGKLENGALYTFSFEGAQHHITGVDLEVTGSRGVLRMKNIRGFQNVDDNTITGFHDDETDFHDLPVPESYRYLKDSGLDNSVQDLAYHFDAYAKGEGYTTYEDALKATEFIEENLEQTDWRNIR